MLAVFVLVQVGSYRDFRAYFNADEWFYRAYSEKLAGEPTPEKNAYLASETARFAELQNELADYARITEGNEDALQFMARDVLSALRAQDGFEQAKQRSCWNVQSSSMSSCSRGSPMSMRRAITSCLATSACRRTCWTLRSCSSS